MECRTATPILESGKREPIAPSTGVRTERKTCPPVFRDNFEHLQALEKEAKYMIASAFLRRNPAGEIGRVFSFLPQDVSPDRVVVATREIATENREREEISVRQGVDLNFVAYVNARGLDHFERAVLTLLLMRVVSEDFSALFEKCRFEENHWPTGIKIGTLLFVICPELRDQLFSRRYFSIDGTLEKKKIIRCGEDGFAGPEKVLGKRVYLDESALRRILGDDDNYSAAFRFLKEGKSLARLEQVILPEGVKEEIATLAGDYLKNRDAGALQSIDLFFAYGTGLVYLFYGPSGTGKTLMAEALASNFGRPLLTVAWEDIEKSSMTAEEVLGLLFREAELRGGIVFLDECDDIFQNATRRSRALLVEIEKARCIVILATNKPIDLDPALERRIAMKAHFPMPDADMRLKLWKALIPDTVALAEDVDLFGLAENYQFSGGLIKNCILLAVTKSIEAEGGGPPVLTQEMLEHAADLQKSSFTEELVTGSPYVPAAAVASLPLRRKQQEELARIAPLWAEVKAEGQGLHLLVCSSSLSVGILAAEALARECRLKVRKFPLPYLLTVQSDENEIIDPVTQRSVSPLEYAFTQALGETYMTLFTDDEGMFDLASGKNLQTGENLFFSRFFGRLRDHIGLTCTVCPTARMRTLPAGFDLSLVFQHPSEEMQLREWETHLGQSSRSEEELIELVERHPMHLSEIAKAARRAGLRSFLRTGESKPTFSDIYDAIAAYHPRNEAPLLFGKKY